MSAVRRGDLEPGSRVVLVVTGARPQSHASNATTIDPDVRDVLQALGLAS
jgi:hypothetical protein